MITVRALESDDLDEPLLLVRPDGLVLDGNAAATRLLGSAAVGANLTDLVEDSPGRVLELLDQQVRTTGPAPGMLQFRAAPGPARRIVGRRRSATEAEVLLRLLPVHDQFREITRTLDRMNAEIARRVQVEAELQQVLGTTVLDLEDSNERLRSFARVAAHDLRSPLAVIVGLAELLSDGGLPGESTEALASRIVAAGRGCAELIETLHEEATRSADATTARLDVAEEIEWVRRMNADDVLILEAVLPLPVVRGSRVSLRQVLLNLVANAVKHCGGRDTVLVQVSATTRDGWAEICVADDGPGVPEELLDRVLQRGVQLDEARPGTGLGLHLCRKMVEQHGGGLRLAHSPLGGLAVYFSLPSAD